MSATSLKPVIEKLESLFSSFNQKFYNGELQTPVITVSPDTTKGAYGWCTSWKAWSNLDPDSKTTDISQMSKADLDAMQNEGFYEINICAEHLARPFEQVAETLLHEMVHLKKGKVSKMALGGGTFVTQNKILPGAYINFVSLASASATLSDRGTVTMPLMLDWGNESGVFEVTNGDFQKSTMKLFGYAYTDDKMKGLRDLFKKAKTLYAYRLNGGGKKASNTFATAKYSGTRGNDLKIVIQKNADTTRFM